MDGLRKCYISYLIYTSGVGRTVVYMKRIGAIKGLLSLVTEMNGPYDKPIRNSLRKIAILRDLVWFWMSTPNMNMWNSGNHNIELCCTDYFKEFYLKMKFSRLKMDINLLLWSSTITVIQVNPLFDQVHSCILSESCAFHISFGIIWQNSKL